MTGTEPRYVQICPGRPLPSIAQFAPFRAVIVLNTEYDRAWQDEVSDWLVASGCLYVMAWGPDCSNWDDSVDWANLTANASEIPDAKFIMTTWHDDDTLEDTFWYAEFNARFSYDDVELHEAVIVDVSQRTANKNWSRFSVRPSPLRSENLRTSRRQENHGSLGCFVDNRPSTQPGTSTLAGPYRLSSKNRLPWLGSRLISSVRAPQ